MNKFVLIPKDQYEKFKEIQESKDKRAPNNNHIPENKSKTNQSDEDFNDTTSGQLKLVQKPRKSSFREVPPPPGLPDQYINSSNAKSQSQILDVATSGGANYRDIIQVGNGATGKGSSRRPEWLKFWNKNIR